MKGKKGMHMMGDGKMMKDSEMMMGYGKKKPAKKKKKK